MHTKQISDLADGQQLRDWHHGVMLLDTFAHWSISFLSSMSHPEFCKG
jgi:hypothetical protein